MSPPSPHKAEKTSSEEGGASKGEVSLHPYLPDSTTPAQTEGNGELLIRKADSDEDVDEAYNLAGDVAIAYTAEEEKRVRRKCDMIVLPLLASV